MELQTKVETYRVDKLCDKCEGGVMQFIGNENIDCGRWQHKCKKCEGISWLDKLYPFMAYKDTSNIIVGEFIK